MTSPPSPLEPADRPGPRLALQSLAVVGTAISLLAYKTHLAVQLGVEDAGAGCRLNQHFDCAAVIGSEWSVFFGIPLALWGIAFYLTVFAVTRWSAPGRTIDQRGGAAVLWGMGAVSAVASILLFAVSELIIRAVCLYCIGMYLTNFLIFLATRKLTPSESLGTRIQNVICAPIQGIGFLLGRNSAGDGRRWALSWSIFLAWFIAVGLILLVPVERFLGSAEQVGRAGTPINKIDGTPYGDYARGALNAPIQITEFADLECPGCRRMYVDLHKLLGEYEGKYSFVFRHFPLDNRCNPSIERPFHLLACHAAILARCAGEQGQYWEALDFLFQAEALEGSSSSPAPDLEARLSTDLAHHLSLDEEGLQSCVTSGRQLPALLRDINEALRVGLEVTPSIWVNGKLIRPLSKQALVEAFETALKNAD
jgi:protein-disulfide isomerase/uncharacterized membrane protein